jgi:T5SS/PEP-CTERM-associated repeat protein
MRKNMKTELPVLTPLAWLTVFVVLLCPPFIPTAHAQTIDTWLPGVKGTFKWETGSNWSLGVPPSTAQTVLINTNITGAKPHQRTVVIDATTASSFPGTMVINNLTVEAPIFNQNTLLVNNTGSAALTIDDSLTISTHGVVSIDNSVLLVNANGVFTDGGITVDGDLLLNTGTIMASNSLASTRPSLVIGSAGPGTMTVLDGTLGVLFASVGDGAAGTLSIAGGAVSIPGGNLVSTSTALSIGSSAGATGSVWLTGGQLTVGTNGSSDLIIGDNGIGQMTVSNGTFLARSKAYGVVLGVETGSQGTLSLAGGTNTFISDCRIGIGGTGTVWLTGGQLTTTNGSTYVGTGTVGSMTVSNGTWLSRNILVATGGGSQGTLTVAGGTSISTNVIIGFDCISTGIINVVGGELDVTNAAGSAVLEVRSGTFTLNSGTVTVDKFVMTNACAHFVRTGGTLIYGSAVLNPNDDTDGDGIPNGYEQAHGLDPLNAADANLDSDGDGLSNLQEFLAGTDATNSASAFRITSVLRTNNDIRITWMMGSGKTNALQRTAGTVNGSYQTNNFTDLFIVTNTLGAVTNYLDVGGATNAPARYYRVRLVP